jgi:hypothetical protein
MGHIAFDIPKLQRMKCNFSEYVLNFIELLFEGVFFSGQGVEYVLAGTLTFEVFIVVIFFDIFYFLDLIFIKVLCQILLLPLGYVLHVIESSEIPILAINP